MEEETPVNHADKKTTSKKTVVKKRVVKKVPKKSAKKVVKKVVKKTSAASAKKTTKKSTQNVVRKKIVRKKVVKKVVKRAVGAQSGRKAPTGVKRRRQRLTKRTVGIAAGIALVGCSAAAYIGITGDGGPIDVTQALADSPQLAAATATAPTPPIETTASSTVEQATSTEPVSAENASSTASTTAAVDTATSSAATSTATTTPTASEEPAPDPLPSATSTDETGTTTPAV